MRGADPKEAAKFDEFWQVWPKSPRKVDKAKCLKAWKQQRLDSLSSEVIAHVLSMSLTEQWRSGFEPSPLTYLNGQRWNDPLPPEDYDGAALAVFEAYNTTLCDRGWPEAAMSPYSKDRAVAVSEFLGFGTKSDWVKAYFDWMRDNLPPKAGYGFDWIIRRDTYLRAREGNFAALQGGGE